MKTASRTAERVALRRAAHQLYDDPLAMRILPEESRVELREREEMERTHPFARAMRAFLCARSRFAEDALERVVAAGLRQYVVLGAGGTACAPAGVRVYARGGPGQRGDPCAIPRGA
jgi:O-methyltransferase involved in polyketide biosynthesis